MTLRELKNKFIEGLPDYNTSEAEAIFFILIEQLWGYSKVGYLNYNHQDIKPEQWTELMLALQRLQDNEPLQYITGETEFYGMCLKVSRDTLIPRPETEELVALIANSMKKATHILDLGTGSGCLALALKKVFPQASCTGVDISDGALAVANQNAGLNHLKVEFLKADILGIPSFPNPYDLIVSNPPYIRQSEKEGMDKQVVNFEPGSALFVPDSDPLLFYRAIEKIARQYLREGGSLFMEINQKLGLETLQIFKSAPWTKATLHSDLSGNDRFVEVRK